MSSDNFLTFLILASLFIGSCSYRPSLIPPTEPLRSAWLKDFLSQSSCQPPCWENITPGITTYGDAKAKLLNNTSLKITDTTNFKGKEIEWDFDDGSSGLLGTEPTGERVEKIIFYLGKDTLVSLEDILDVVSNPSSFTFNTSNVLKFCDFLMFFESSGMIVSSGLIPCKVTEKDGVYYAEISVTPDIPIQYIDLYPKELVEKQAKMLGKMEWKGYGEYLREYRP